MGQNKMEWFKKISAGKSLICVLIALSFSALPAYAAKVKKLEKLIEKKDYMKAVEVGEKYLAKKPDASDAAQVRKLMMKAEFLNASDIDTLEAYEAFEKKYPHSPYQADVDELKSKVVFRTVISAPGCSIADCRDFRKRFPNSTLLPKVIEIEQDLAWKEAETANSVEEWRKFRLSYPDSPRASRALERETALAWEEAKKLNTLEAVTIFLSVYPHSPFEKDAQELRCHLAWEIAKKTDSVISYRNFRSIYSNCSQVEIAGAREVELVWEEVKKENTWRAYLNFQRSYPYSTYAREAERRGLILWEFDGPLGADELLASVNSINDADPDNIHIYVQAQGPDSEVVGGLLERNFTVFENGCPASITRFEGMESDRPVDIVFALDISGSMQDKIDSVKDSIIEFVRNLSYRNRDVQLGMVTFITTVTGVYPPGDGMTKDTAEFQRWISLQTAYSGGVEDAFDAIIVAQKKKFRKGAQVIFILITDEDIFETGRASSWTYQQIIDIVNKRHISLVVIAPDQPKHRWLASATGGSFFTISDYPNFEWLIKHISNITAKQYHIVYQATGCAPTSQDRKVRVRIRRDYLWLPVARLAVKNISCMLIDPARVDRCYMATRDFGLYISADGGINWKRVGENLGEASFIKLIATSKKGGRILALSEAGRLFISNDYGETWVAVNGAPEKIVSIVEDPADIERLFATDGRSLFASSNGGVSWFPVSNLNEEGAGVSLLFIDAVENMRLIALDSGNTSRISLDGGKTWKPFEMSLPSGEVDLASLSVYSNPNWPGYYFLITSNGRLFRSLDKGKSWEDITPPVSSASGQLVCHELTFDPSWRHWLILSTSLGVYVSKNNGLKWFPLTEGIDRSDMVSPAVAVGRDGRMHIGSSGSVYMLNPVADREFLSSSVLFSFGSAKLNPEVFSFLDDLAEHLRDRPDLKVRIEGHTDDIGEDAYNMDLSIRRAESVRDYLVQRGVDAARLIRVGF